MRRRTASALPDDAESVRVIDHHGSAVFFREPADRRQIGEVAADREHAIDDDKAPCAVRYGGETPLKGFHVIVAIAQHLAEAHLRGAIDARMVFRIADQVIVASHERADRAHVRHVARRPHDGVLRALEGREVPLKACVLGQGARHETRRTRSRAVTLDRRTCRLLQARVFGKILVVVRGEGEDVRWPRAAHAQESLGGGFA